MARRIMCAAAILRWISHLYNFLRSLASNSANFTYFMPCCFQTRQKIEFVLANSVIKRKMTGIVIFIIYSSKNKKVLK